jgi:isopenicillin N synthase-like dioxygenase
MHVKVCDMMSESFDKDFIDSVVNTGFAVLTNHGIRHDLIKATQSEWRNFFTKDQEYKGRFADHEDHNMGYKGLKSEKAVGAKAPDLKEFYHWHPGKMIPLELVGSTLRVYSDLEGVSQKALNVLDNHFARYSVGPNTFQKSCRNSNNTILRTLYYPAMDFSAEPDAVRAAAHEDINFVTLLVASTASGLQVKDKEGKWHDVPHEENSITLNIGDMLQLASNGLYKSTTHRVVNPENNTTDRISMPLFIHPHGDTVLAPGVTAQQFLDERINQIYMKVK